MKVLFSPFQPPPFPKSSLISVSSKHVEPNWGTQVKVPSSGGRQADRPSAAEQNTTKAAALMAVQEITHPFPPKPTATTSDSSVVADSDGTSAAVAEGGSSATVRKKHMVIVKPVL